MAGNSLDAPEPVAPLGTGIRCDFRNFGGQSLQFTDIVDIAPFFLLRLPGGRPRLRLSDGGAAVTAAGKAVAAWATASGSSLRPKSCTRRTADRAGRAGADHQERHAHRSGLGAASPPPPARART